MVRWRSAVEKPADGHSPVNALRRLLLERKVPGMLEEHKERFRAWKVVSEMLPALRLYPDHRFDTSVYLTCIADNIIRHSFASSVG